MIHFWKDLGLEITDFNYHHDPTPSGEIIPSQTSNLQTCREYKSFRKTTYDTSLERSRPGHHRF